METRVRMPRIVSRIIIFTLFLSLAFIPWALAQPPEVEWLDGPCAVKLGKDVARIDLPAGYSFANAKDARKLMDHIGNPPSGSEAGLILPTDGSDWFLLFEYHPIGYIRDDEGEDIDSDGILEAIKRGTEEANKERTKKGFSPLEVVGWYEPPHYDSRSNNLVWALLAKSQDDEVVNYNMRLLGRHGYMSTILVTSPSILDTYKPAMENVIANFSYQKGKRYAEFVEGDKVAAYGLTALIAGGAGAAAVKVGFFKMLAKAWKVVAAAAVALFAALGKMLRRVFGGRRDVLSSDYNTPATGENT